MRPILRPVTKPLANSDAVIVRSVVSSLPVGSTFTRASTGTFIDGNGVRQTAAIDEPRFENGALLYEPAATNLLRFSDNPTATGWTTGGAVTQSTDVYARDGVTLAYQTPYPDQTQFRVFDGSSFIVQDPITPTEELQRVTATFTTGPSVTSVRVYSYRWAGGSPAGFKTETVLPNTVYTAAYDVWRNAGSTILYFTDFQLELGSKATSYIPTSAGSQVTRAADALTLALPYATSDVTFTFDDNSTQAATGVSSPYVVPTTLNRPHIKTIKAEAA